MVLRPACKGRAVAVTVPLRTPRVNTVDELVVEVAPGELEEVREIVEREMDGAIELLVPLEVSAGTGANWDAAAH